MKRAPNSLCKSWRFCTVQHELFNWCHNEIFYVQRHKSDLSNLHTLRRSESTARQKNESKDKYQQTMTLISLSFCVCVCVYQKTRPFRIHLRFFFKAVSLKAQYPLKKFAFVPSPAVCARCFMCLSSSPPIPNSIKCACSFICTKRVLSFRTFAKYHKFEIRALFCSSFSVSTRIPIRSKTNQWATLTKLRTFSLVLCF